MTKQATFTTARGAEIRVAITEGRVTVAINGTPNGGTFQRIDSAQHGAALRTRLADGREMLIPVPASVVADVDAVFAQHRADLAASVEAKLVSEREYDRGYDRTMRGMAE